MIDINNYEGYLFLYQEGELDKEGRTQVEQFLAAHPDIKTEMAMYYDTNFVVTAEPQPTVRHIAKPVWGWAVAACLAVAVGSTILYLGSNSGNYPGLSGSTYASLTMIPQPVCGLSNPNSASTNVCEMLAQDSDEDYSESVSSEEPDSVGETDNKEVPPKARSESIQSTMIEKTQKSLFIETNLLAEVSNVKELDCLAEVNTNWDIHKRTFESLMMVQEFGKQKVVEICKTLIGSNNFKEDNTVL